MKKFVDNEKITIFAPAKLQSGAILKSRLRERAKLAKAIGGAEPDRFLLAHLAVKALEI